MAREFPNQLSRRERQILEIIYRQGKASAAEVLAALPDPPSYSAVRALLRLLEQKGHVRHQREGRRYVFSPTVAASQARRSVLRNLLHNFFEGSVEQAVASLLELKSRQLSDEQLDRLAELIDRARDASSKTGTRNKGAES